MNTDERIEQVGIDLAMLAPSVARLARAAAELRRANELQAAKIQRLKATAELQTQQIAESMRRSRGSP